MGGKGGDLIGAMSPDLLSLNIMCSVFIPGPRSLLPPFNNTGCFARTREI